MTHSICHWGRLSHKNYRYALWDVSLFHLAATGTLQSSWQGFKSKFNVSLNRIVSPDAHRGRLPWGIHFVRLRCATVPRHVSAHRHTDDLHFYQAAFQTQHTPEALHRGSSTPGWLCAPLLHGYKGFLSWSIWNRAQPTRLDLHPSEASMMKRYHLTNPDTV